MGRYNVHAGHCPQGQGAHGAVGLLQESVEDRKVKNRVISALRNSGDTVYDCTDDTNCTVNQNLQRIVTKCNAHSVDKDISIHLNSGRNDYVGDGSTGGVEVWCYSAATADLAARICANISKELGIRNRGVKYSQSLYVLRRTNAPAVLVECCFVDDKDDANRWNADRCGDAIASAIHGNTIHGSSQPPVVIPAPIPMVTGGNVLVRDGQIHANNFVGAGIATDGIWGPKTQMAAIKVVQHAMNMDYGAGLVVDGIWGPRSDKALGNHYVMSGEIQYMVTAWQILLMLRGFNPNGVECPGMFGDGCENATWDLQELFRIKKDGVAGRVSFKTAMGV